MARKRMIDPLIWEDEHFGGLSDKGKVLFIACISNADDEGRLSGNVANLKAIAFRFNDITNKKVEDIVTEIRQKIKNFKYYFVDESSFIQLDKWHKHQQQRSDRIQPSKYPAPPENVSIYDILKEVKGDNEPLKVKVARRDKMCRYCGIKFKSSSRKFVLEHIIPTSKGGETNDDNCVLACHNCNTKKSNRTPEEANMKLLPITTAARCGETPQDAAEVKVSKDKVSKDKVSKDKVREGKVVEIIADLNAVLNASYKSTTKNIIDLIEARIRDGFSVDDFRAVHRNMSKRWGTDNKMRKYLRPTTLYSGKFDDYLNMKQDLPLSTAAAKTFAAGQEWIQQGGQ